MNALPIFGAAAAVSAGVYGYHVGAKKGYFGDRAPYMMLAYAPTLASGVTALTLGVLFKQRMLPSVVAPALGIAAAQLYGVKITSRKDQQELKAAMQRLNSIYGRRVR